MTLSENFHVMSMPGYGPWARLAYFRGSSEKGERVRGLIIPEIAESKKGIFLFPLVEMLLSPKGTKPLEEF